MIDVVHLGELQRARGISTRGLAVKAGVARRTLYNARQGRPVTLETAVRLAHALGVPVADLSQSAADTLTACEVTS